MENKITETSLMERYKPIEVYIRKPLSENERNLIKEIERIFSKNELFFKINDTKIILLLREIDLNYFEYNINKLIEKYNINKSYNPFSELVEKIKEIKSYGLKCKRRLYVGYDKERKVKNRKLKEIERGKFFYALGHSFSKKNNELPSEFTNKIICGDSEEILKKLPDNCIDLIFTSPPYNFGLQYENHKDGVDWNQYFNKLFAIFKECIRVLKYGGRIIVNVQPLFSDYIPIHHIISNFFIENKLIWKGEILWDKHNYNCKYTAWGSWKSPSNPYLKYTWEFLEIFCKGELRHRGNARMADITAEEFKKWVFAKWDIAPEYNMKQYGHPAMFPEELAKRVIKLFGFERGVVLDPFNGVGTTTKVAKELNRRFIGIDISEDYCKKAEERMKNISYQKTLR